MTATAKQVRHPAVALLARYRTIFAAAWAMRHELAGPKRLADEAAFLPAALALQETPVHPAPRRALWLIMALFSFAIVWAWVGELDIVAVAPGRIVVSEGTKVIQPLESGIVRAIHVKDGDQVQAGQLLIELDATTARADSQALQAQAEAAQTEVHRAQALLQALGQLGQSGTGPRSVAPSAAPKSQPQPSAEATAHGEAEVAELRARLARMDAEAYRREAEVRTARESLAKLQAMLPLARQRESDVAALAQQGFVAGHAGQDRARERLEIERDLATQQARVAEVEAALAESRQTRQALLAETRRQQSERLNKARLDQAQLQQQATKSEHRERITRLLSPVAGTVQQLAVRTAGGVVTPAQPLLVVVPHEAEITAEVTVENKDVGFVHVGQSAEVKIDAFSFTRYGTVPAVVSRVSADAVLDEKRGPAFTATLRLQSAKALSTELRGLRPGMSLTGEIRTGSRTVMNYVLSPIEETVRQGAKER